MKISLDGGETWTDAKDGVRVMYEDLERGDNSEVSTALHVNLTNEGIVLDVWSEGPDGVDRNIGTSSEMAEEIVERILDENGSVPFDHENSWKDKNGTE